MSLPKMSTTEEAIAFGKIATYDEIVELKLNRKYCLVVCSLKPEDASIECLEGYLRISFKGQLMREALESAGHPCS